MHDKHIDQQKSTSIALIGAPNAGKSTLINCIVGSKVSIVSPKVQTTRVTIRGICMRENTQLVFLDTPGIFIPKKTLERSIVKEAWRGVYEAEHHVLLVDAGRGLCHNTLLLIDALKNQEREASIIFNKIDMIASNTLLPLVSKANELFAFKDTFMISAKTNEGVEDVVSYYVKNAPVMPWLYPEDEVTDAPARFFAAELTREQLFLAMNEEVPYALMVDTEQWEERDNGSLMIKQVIYVKKDGQKAIILGKRGEKIKEIGTKARIELEKEMGCKVHLYLFVKVKEDWVEKPFLYGNEDN